MKKLFTILLSFCFVLPAFAGNVGSVNNEAWLEHIAQMQSLRQQIMGLVSKSNPTFEDRDQLAVLKQDFNDRKASWDAYLVEVAEGRAVETVAPAADCSQQNSEKMDCSSKKDCCKGNKHECTDACKDKCKAACCGVKGCDCKGKKQECSDACKDKCKEACGAKKGCEGKEKKHECTDACKDKCKEACGAKKGCEGKEKKMKCGSRKNCKGHGKKDECGKKSEKKSCTPKNAKCGGC